jgi:hypothetical protein
MSEVKVNKISPRSGTTVTLGDSGDTFTIPSGATINNQGTATNFGATGSASWVTTVKTNSDSGFTATAGEGYFLNTTAGTISVNLPAGSAGAVVAFKDYAKTWDTNAVTLVQNGSDKIGGSTVNATLDTEGSAVTLVFIDSTQGWLVTDDGLQSSAATATFVTATGGTILTSGNFKTHVFTSPGTFAVSCAGNAAGSNTIDYTVIAGGGGGGQGASPVYMGGAGGAGGFRLSNSVGCLAAPVMSPLANPTGLPVTATSYPVTIGAGGAKAPADSAKGSNGADSVFAGSSTITSAGGGFGAAGAGTPESGGPGGSGGGSTNAQPAGSGNTPPVSPPQGNNGGVGAPGNTNSGAGGGGAGAVGSNSPSPSSGGAGGIGSFISDSAFGPTAPSYGQSGPVSNTRYFAGGGSGSSDGAAEPGGVTGGIGGGGRGATGSPTVNAADGTTNTGGGGGGGSGCGSGTGLAGNGGSGIVLIRYKFQ